LIKIDFDMDMEISQTSKIIFTGACPRIHYDGYVIYFIPLRIYIRTHVENSFRIFDNGKHMWQSMYQ
jgi:hypothetical protein